MATNTILGDNALDDVTTGENNTAIGYHALGNNTTGSNNIAIGKDAGNILTDENNNILIGNIGQEGHSNQIRIGTQGVHERVDIPINESFPEGACVVYSGGSLGTSRVPALPQYSIIFIKSGYSQSSHFSAYTNIGTFSTMYRDTNGHPQVMELDIMVKN